MAWSLTPSIDPQKLKGRGGTLVTDSQTQPDHRRRSQRGRPRAVADRHHQVPQITKEVDETRSEAQQRRPDGERLKYRMAVPS